MSFYRPFAFCCSLLLPLASPAAELVVLIDAATEMPLARFENYQLVDGINKDVGLALAKAMGREPRFLALPRKRLVGALESGAADVLCGFIPEWLRGSFAWSQPFLPLVEVVISDVAAERPRALADLRGEPVGTVFGYAYPELERALGKDFVRVEGPSGDLNLRKLSLGRLRHMITSKARVDYRLKVGDPLLKLHRPLLVKSHVASCAVSSKANVSLAQVERAVGQLLRNGTVPAIMARYR